MSSNGDKTTDVLVIGAGIAGIEASLLLAAAGRRVHLVEKTSAIGGMVVKCEEVFANLECATCMVRPRPQGHRGVHHAGGSRRRKDTFVTRPRQEAGNRSQDIGDIAGLM